LKHLKTKRLDKPVIPARVFTGINSSRNPDTVLALDSRSPIDTFEDKFHGNDTTRETERILFKELN
jgi:hypothetical protein